MQFSSKFLAQHINGHEFAFYMEMPELPAVTGRGILDGSPYPMNGTPVFSTDDGAVCPNLR